MAANKGFFRAAYEMFRPVQAVALTSPAPAPAASAPVAAPAASDPLAAMAAVWKNDPTRTPTADPLAGPVLNMDPAKIADASSKIDLLASINPELMAKAKTGDGEAIVQLIQLAAQSSLATGAQISASATEQGLQRQAQRFVQALPDRIKQHAITTAQATHPALQHAASQPFLQMTRQQIAASNPTLSPAEVNSQAESTLLGYAAVLSGNQDDGSFREGGISAQPGAKPATDWGKWAGVEL